MSYARLITRFADAMAEQLDANSWKTGWGRMSGQELLRCLRQEVGELAGAIKVGTAEEIVREAADVGNFAAMIAANSHYIMTNTTRA